MPNQFQRNKTATTPLCLGPIGVVCMSCKVYFYVLIWTALQIYVHLILRRSLMGLKTIALKITV